MPTTRKIQRKVPANATAEERRTAEIANISVGYLRRMRREGGAPRILTDRVSFISGDAPERTIFGKRWAEEPDRAGAAATVPVTPVMRFNSRKATV